MEIDAESLVLSKRVVAAQTKIFKLQSKQKVISSFLEDSKLPKDQTPTLNLLHGMQTSIDFLSEKLDSKDFEPKTFKYSGK